MKAPITSESEMRELVIDLLSHVAPEADAGAIDPDAGIQDQLDIDSIDFLNFIMAVHEKTGIDVPERDYAKVATLNDCVRYLAAKAA
ncbi:MAG TPA: phosphopantetheine-binding protein [Trueperaceae bacterium]|nr:phosphopantetheine-binding protein [Trueperaceae bacterium]